MPSLKYYPALSLGVALSGLILGVSCTSLFTGVTSSSNCGKQVVEEETHKPRVRKVHNTGGNTEPSIKLPSNRAADSFPVKESIGGSVPGVSSGMPNQELTAPIVSRTGVPLTPETIPPPKVAVNSGSSVGDMGKNPEKMPSVIAQNLSETPKPVESPKKEPGESPRKEPVTVSENNVVRIVEVAGNDVIVTSFDAVIIIKGRCGKLTVAGGKNRIQCDVVREIEVIGNGNTMNLTKVEKGTVFGNSNEISWKELINGSEPKFISTGVDNKLLHTP